MDQMFDSYEAAFAYMMGRKAKDAKYKAEIRATEFGQYLLVEVA